MRKKKLIEQNLHLFENLQKTQHELSEVKKQLSQSVEEINSLKFQLAKMQTSKNEPITTEPMRKLEEKIIANATLKPDMDYASKIIGKIVVAAAEHSNKLTLGGDDSKKELLNLILGKTELAKAEILTVVESSASLDVKCAKIDNIADVAFEYFKSVAEQIV